MHRLQITVRPTESTKRFLENGFQRTLKKQELSEDILQYVSRSADYVTYARLLAQVL